MVLGILILAGPYALAASGSRFKIEIIPAPACHDGLDNDGDTLVDYPADPGCASFLDNNESDVVTPPVTPPVSGGGGGGGGGGDQIYVQPVMANASFSGRAYPLSQVVVLKDGQMAVTTVAGPDANFSVNLGNLSTGSYNFAVYGQDSANRRSNLFTFPVFVSSGATVNITGIFIPPTIQLDKSEVKQGDNLAIFGQSTPGAQVEIQVNSNQQLFLKTTADKNGAYFYNLDTASLEVGDHQAKSKTLASGEISPYSESMVFAVGSQNKEAKPSNELKSDLNGDGRVNLVDFSIEAYWYKKENPPVKYDFNGDGRVDLVDFSILAFYWRG